MKTALTEMFELEVPLCAFTHCRDVAIEVSKSGGLGVLGTSRYSSEQLDIELSKIDAALDGRPYGVSVIFPGGALDEKPLTEAELAGQIPEEYRTFVRSLADQFGIPLGAVSDGGVSIDGIMTSYPLTQEHAQEMVEVVLRHPVRLVSSALGAPAPEVVERLRAHGVKIAGLVGHPKHVARQIAAGADLIVATGTEAGGHTGEIGSFVLTPLIVDAADGVPVLLAGGVGTGRQIVAALALGAHGVWTGSVWLPTVESDLPEVLKERILQASASDTIRTRSLSGRTVRQLRTPWVEAWEAPGAPTPLKSPLQGMLQRDVMVSMFKQNNQDALGTPAGQIIGSISASKSVKEVMLEFMLEVIDTAENVQDKMSDSTGVA